MQWNIRILRSLIKRRCFREDAHSLIINFRKLDFDKFKTLAKAKAYIKDHEIKNYKYEINQETKETTLEKKKTTYYAITNDCILGIHEYY